MILNRNVIVVLFLFSAVISAEPINGESANSAIESDTTGQRTSERRVIVDSATGKIVPSSTSQNERDTEFEIDNTPSNNDTDEKTQEKRSSEKLATTVDKAGELKQMSDGSMMVELNGQFDIPLRAQISPNGKLDIGHRALSTKDRALSNQNRALSSKDKALSSQDKAMSSQNKALSSQDNAHSHE